MRGGLDLTKANLGTGESKKQLITEKWNTFGEVEKELNALGIKDMKHPGSDELPEIDKETLATLDSHLYTSKFCEFQNWCSFVGQLRANCDAEILQYKNMMEIISLETRKNILEASTGGTKKPSKEEIQERIERSTEFQDVWLIFQRLQQKRLKLVAAHERLETGLRLISRQIEIRKLDMEQNKTENNMPTRDRYGRPR